MKRLIACGAVMSLIAAFICGCGDSIRSPEPSKPIVSQNINSAKDEVRSVAYSPDGQLVAAGFIGHAKSVTLGSVQLWSAVTHKPVKMWRTDSVVNQVAFSSDSKTLLSANDEGVRLWQVPTGRMLHSISNNVGLHLTTAFSADGRTLAIGGTGRLELWDVKARKKRRTLGGSPQFAVGLAFSPDGKNLASTHNDIGMCLTIWDVITGKPNIKNANAIGLSNVVFSHDGKRLASAVEAINGGVWVWNVRNGKVLQKLGSEEDAVTCIALSPDGNLLIDNGVSKLRLWDVRSGKLLRSWSGHGPVALSPNGRTMVSVRGNGLVHWQSVKRS